jgi:hypothetical protein
MSDWYAEIEPEERDRVIENIAQAVAKRGMETPAIIFLEMHKPISFFASQGMIVSSPFLAPLIGLDNLRIAARLFEKRDNVELLIRRIEELAVEKQESRKRKSGIESTGGTPSAGG